MGEASLRKVVTPSKQSGGEDKRDRSSNEEEERGHALILKAFLGGLGSLPLQFHLWLLFPCLVARRALHRPLSSFSLDERSRLSSPPDCLLGVTTFLKLASPMIILS